MSTTMNISRAAGWIFGSIVFAIGVLNFVFVHPVPGVVAILLSALYIPPVYQAISEKTGFSIYPFIKIAIGVIIILFTLGVSDLGDMIDKL